MGRVVLLNAHLHLQTLAFTLCPVPKQQPPSLVNDTAHLQYAITKTN